jgi:hypothetical protein
MEFFSASCGSNSSYLENLKLKKFVLIYVKLVSTFFLFSPKYLLGSDHVARECQATRTAKSTCPCDENRQGLDD